MSIKLFKALGIYYPSFFILDINEGDEVDDLNQMTDYQEAIFKHEYIHYLQDITTLFGLMNCIHNVDLLKYYTKYISDLVTASYPVPIIIPHSDTGAINHDLISLYVGDFQSIENYEIEDIVSEQNGVIPGYEFAEAVVVSIKNNSTRIRFGAMSIIENMAYAMEKELCKQPIKSPEHPYDAVEKLVRFIYPEILSTKQNLIALCDLSLLCQYDPGKFLFETLQIMKKEQFMTDDYNEIYSYCLSGSIPFKGKNISVMEMFHEISTQAEKQLGDLFTNAHTAPIKEWIKNKITLARELRTSNPTFFVDMVSLDDNQRQKEFSRLTYEFEVPLIRWPSGRYQVSGTTGANLPIFGGIKNILELFSSGNAECDLRQFCNKEGTRNVLRQYCNKNPWETSNHDPLCDYAVPWKMWGLKGKSPNIR